MSDQDLSALIGSRICHDLISPLGAIGNGLELLEMTGVRDGPELALIRDSIETANARLRLFRIAFGAAGPDQRIAGSEVAQALSGFGDKRLVLDWMPPSDLARREARLLLLMLMCAETMMPHGGAVSVSRDPVSVTMRAERFRDAPEFLQPLTDPKAEPPASEIHFSVARRAATEMGCNLGLSRHGGHIVLSS